MIEPPAPRQYDRTTVGRPPDANLSGPLRARPPASVREMRRLADAGVPAASIAEQFGISVRTVYRYLEPGLQYVDVTIGPWVATFAFADEREPWRVSRWRPE